MNPLKIEVTEAMREAAAKAIADKVGHGMREKCETQATAALTAAFQHPEFVAQLDRWLPIESAPEGEYVLLGNPEWASPGCGAKEDGQWLDFGFSYNPPPTHWRPLPEPPRASLGRLLGEEA